MKILNTINTLLAVSLDENNRLEYKPVGNIQLLLETDYSDAFEAFKNGIIIYRGDKNIPYNDFDVYTAIPKIRVSKATWPDRRLNYYTLIFSDILPSWKEYPKRNRSFICTTDLQQAYNYGEGMANIVLPKNGAHLGICSKEDIWYSFDNGFDAVNNIDINGKMNMYVLNDMDMFNVWLYNMFKIFNVKQINTSDSLTQALNELENDIKNCQFKIIKTGHISLIIDGKSIEVDANSLNITDINNTFLYYFYTQIINGKHIIQILDEIFNPLFNGNMLSNIHIYKRGNINGKHEIWTDSECLFLDVENIDILNNLV